MPLIVSKHISSYTTLLSENISLIDKSILNKSCNCIKILILNLMPNKVETEAQLLRVLGFSDYNLDITFLKTQTYDSKNTSKEYLNLFYKTFSQIKNEYFDGMIITGAPVEHLSFEDVIYWDELKKVMDYSCENIKSTFHICWAAQAGLYHHYGINKYKLDKKIFGVFSHKLNRKNCTLLKGFDDEFFAPHSRYTYIRKHDIENVDKLEILSESDDAGVYIVQSKEDFSNILEKSPINLFFEIF